jgi:hypothetical protein
MSCGRAGAGGWVGLFFSVSFAERACRVSTERASTSGRILALGLTFPPLMGLAGVSSFAGGGLYRLSAGRAGSSEAYKLMFSTMTSSKVLQPQALFASERVRLPGVLGVRLAPGRAHVK